MLMMVLMIIVYLGYVLTWGQMSYWGCIIVISSFIVIPCIYEFICGNFHVSQPTLYRFHVFHYLYSLLIKILFIYHSSYLHGHTSSSLLGSYIGSCHSIYPSIISKDILVLTCVLIFSLLSINYSVSHPNNNIIINKLFTPLHLLPEWYFLSLYELLKVYPHKLLGFIIIFSYICIFVLVAEIQLVMCLVLFCTYLVNVITIFSSSYVVNFMHHIYIAVHIGSNIFVSFGR